MKIWVIGCGKFGDRTVAHLLKESFGISITLVDSDQTRLLRWEGKVETVHRDGVEFVAHRLDEGDSPDWIIPALPVHLAFYWIMKTVTEIRLSPFALPKEIEGSLPNSVWGKDGEIYVSQADFMCPEECPEPPRNCTVTGKPRREDLFDSIKKMKFRDLEPLVIRSYQILPGSGGYTPEALFTARKAICKVRGNVMVTTACRCHGVIHGVSIR
ncbi:MAG: potassium transporter [Thermodesulfobacteriota bacterium]